MMNECRKSDIFVVPEKSSNKPDKVGAERMEGRGMPEESKKQRNTCRTQSRESVHSELLLIHQKARADRGMRFTALMHHIYNIDMLRMSFLEMKRNAAPGIDRISWESYGKDMEVNLLNLAGRLQRGTYKAKPVRRVYIPKSDGRQRPLGIAALEDKIVQRATVMVMNSIYEVDFKGFSYGFRPKRSQHQALDALQQGIVTKRVNYVFDADIRDFFNKIERGSLIKFIEHRIADKRLLRFIQRWMNAGIMDRGKIVYEDIGVIQGNSASPLLANVFLHYVYDLWISQWRKKTSGDVIVVRYADDTVVGFEHKADAENFQVELKERLLKFGLELHPEKTRLIEFGRFASINRKKRGERKPETFTFLGFTHICGITREKGKFTVHRRTIRKKMRTKVKEIKIELKKRMHEPIHKVGQWLRTVVSGHYRYYGVPGNGLAMNDFRRQVSRRWKNTLGRRSQKRRITWEKMGSLVERWLPRPQICHKYPSERFGVMI